LGDFGARQLAVNGSAKFLVKPLYLQVRDAVLDRIRSGKLGSGGLLPSEADLHREFGVSLGTLRKALSVLQAEQIIVREPGRGTFARSYQTDGAQERFNPIRSKDGVPLRGLIKIGKAKLGTPKAAERTALTLGAGDRVVRFARLRSFEGRGFAYEFVCLPERRFPDLMSRSQIPDDLEELAKISGVLLARAEGKVRALAVPSEVATALSVAERTVVLCLERVVFDTQDTPIEMMTAYYDLKDEYCSLLMR
jgi:GntR family transcriptional regulator